MLKTVTTDVLKGDYEKQLNWMYKKYHINKDNIVNIMSQGNTIYVTFEQDLE
jgi:hypothetical protein